jgi:hypothetical protein
MDLSYPFTAAFGLADNRVSCIESAQNVYRNLLLNEPDEGVLSFETIAILAANEDGELDQEKTKDLIRIFRPNREGRLTCLEFVKSIDSVYKSLRTLRASIHNSSQIDRAFELIINFFFYLVLLCVVLATFEVDPLAIFLSFSSIIVAFAFIIGGASSKYFEVSNEIAITDSSDFSTHPFLFLGYTVYPGPSTI